MKRSIAALAIALSLVVADAAQAASRLVVRTDSVASVTSRRACHGDVQLQRVLVNGRELVFAEQAGDVARLYGRGAVVEVRHNDEDRVTVKVAAVRRVRVVAVYTCER